jgi:hypothetical protein
LQSFSYSFKICHLNMAGVTFTVEGTTKDGKKVKVEIILKKFCKCKPSLGENCIEKAKEWADQKIKNLLQKKESSELTWLEGKVNPNFFMEVMEEMTEVLENACVTARSEHLQGAQVNIEFLD